MLALTFAMTYPPERSYLSSMLGFVKKTRIKVPVYEIAEITGIPNGKSNGKVVPTLKYLEGMNLIMPDGKGWYFLTGLGNTVYSFDKKMEDPITAWTCSMFMCNEHSGSLFYREAFNYLSIYGTIEKQELIRLVSEKIGLKNGKSIASTFVGFYTNDNAFGYAKIISLKDKKITLNRAPIKKTFVPMYGAFICFFMKTIFIDKEQVSLTEFVEKTGFCQHFKMTKQDFNLILDLVAGEGYINVSNLVNPPVFSICKDLEECWNNLYLNVV